jgi:hypothetical protein
MRYTNPGAINRTHFELMRLAEYHLYGKCTSEPVLKAYAL